MMNLFGFVNLGVNLRSYSFDFCDMFILYKCLEKKINCWNSYPEAVWIQSI